MLIPVQVLASRNYSFAGADGHPVNVVEIHCLLTLDAKSVIGKINTRGVSALQPGNYQARLYASERGGKLVLSLGDFTLAAAATSSAAAYKTASGAN